MSYTEINKWYEKSLNQYGFFSCTDILETNLNSFVNRVLFTSRWKTIFFIRLYNNLRLYYIGFIILIIYWHFYCLKTVI